MTDQTRDRSRTHLVNRYFTPLAVLLVANGLILSDLPGSTRAVSLGLLAFSILFNSLSIGWIDRGAAPQGRRLAVRVNVNFAVSVLQVYLLGRAWPPAWLLLMLTPVACAIYGARRDTIRFSFLAFAALMVLHGLRGPSSAVAWAMQFNGGAFIVLLSLALYELSQIVRAEAGDSSR